MVFISHLPLYDIFLHGKNSLNERIWIYQYSGDLISYEEGQRRAGATFPCPKEVYSKEDNSLTILLGKI